MKIKMKKKLLDVTLTTILFGVAPVVAAQDGNTLNCGEQGCTSGDSVLFTVRHRDATPAATEIAAATQPAHIAPMVSIPNQPRRPVVVAQAATTQASAAPVAQARPTSSFGPISLPGGGLIWASEDPNLGQPELAISAPSYVAYDGSRITKPLKFVVRANYASFIDHYELSIYRASDTDLVEPLVNVPIEVGAVSETDWDGVLPAKYNFQAGDQLVYVLRAYDKKGNFDETYPLNIQLVRPEEAERGQVSLTNSASKLTGTVLSADQAQVKTLLDDVFAGNGLRQQNIPVYGSRIRIQGRGLPQGSLLINGESYPVDLERKFAAEYLVPVGQHGFDVNVQASNGAGVQQRLNVDVTGRYFFGVAIADVTMYQNKATGKGKSQALGERTDSVLTDARLAFYLKGKIRGRYLITAQADTGEQDIKEVFTGFTQATPQDIFRSLDPEMYYPTYGDDSNVYRDIDTMGRFYLRMDWDKNQALWGNYNANISGTEYGQYTRSLYGAALYWRSNKSNRWGDPRTEVRLFGSEAESAPGHSEFLGTGGSLYYLKHTDILPGSEQVVLEIRDNTSGRVENRVTMTRGVDYEIDNVQGRVILSRPLSQLTQENVPSITHETPLNGYEQRLLIDYEWVPSNFDDNNLTIGFRGKQWFGDHVGVGGTYVDEERDGADYKIIGGDITLQAGKGTYLKVEQTRTESFSVPNWFSQNGGLSFTELDSYTGPRAGNATAIEARINLKELGWIEQDWSIGAWWRDVDAGYSTSRNSIGQALTEYGAESLARINDNISIYARHTKTERGTDSFTQSQLTGEWRISPETALSAELRRLETKTANDKTAGTLIAVRYTQRFTSKLDMYATVQATLDNDDGKYDDNNAFTIGGKYLYGDMSSIGLEMVKGDRGDAYQINAEHRLNPEHSIYTNYTHATNNQGSDYDSFLNRTTRQSGLTVGQRWRLSSRVNIFNESQWLKEPNQSGLANTFGLDFYPGAGWNTGFTLQQGTLTADNGGNVYRKAVSVSGGLTSADTTWQSKLEWRKDSGIEQREQWVSTNRLTQKLNESWRISARFNYSDTDDKLVATNGARFVEGNAGFAYRPWNNTRWAAFGRYTYTYDRATTAQMSDRDYDQKTQVVSLEGVYKPNANWEFAAKYARREGEVRYGRNSANAWFDSATNFAAGQVRYELANKWHAMGEYRWLDVKNGGSKKGWMVGVDRDISQWMRIGIGYNFTNFSDDLTDFDYNHKGFFLNLVGKY